MAYFLAYFLSSLTTGSSLKFLNLRTNLCRLLIFLICAFRLILYWKLLAFVSLIAVQYCNTVRTIRIEANHVRSGRTMFVKMFECLLQIGYCYTGICFSGA